MLLLGGAALVELRLGSTQLPLQLGGLLALQRQLLAQRLVLDNQAEAAQHLGDGDVEMRWRP